jgi:hypothetical protein
MILDRSECRQDKKELSQMKFVNLTTISIFGLFSFVTMKSDSGALAYAAAQGTVADCKNEEALEPPNGYVFVDQTELSDLNAMPLNLLSDARREFGEGDKSLAAQDLHLAAQLMTIQYEGGSRASHLDQTAKNLDRLSQEVSKNTVKSVGAFDVELTQAAKQTAQHHYLHATEAWSHHMVRNVGADLSSANKALERAAEWSGYKIARVGDSVAGTTESLSKKMLSGGKWTAEEVKKALDSVGTKISAIGKKPEEKTSEFR